MKVRRLPVLSSSSAPIPAGTETAAGPVQDRLGRRLSDLRISVTDRCNFRCPYCMPRESFGPDYRFLPRSDLLSFEELSRVARLAVKLGVGKIRLTGGEPLLRSSLDTLVGMLGELDVDLALTSNGSLLTKHAEGLARAGLRRVTVSLDALDEATFRRMVDANYSVQDVLAGISAAAAAGLGPIKINAVIQRGVNLHAVSELAEYFRGTGHTLRFIEFMDVGSTNHWQPDQVVPAREMLELIERRFPVEPLSANYPGEVAQRYRYRDGAGEVGFITSVSQPFCGGCTRLRLTARGMLHTCLFAAEGFDLRELLRSGATDDELERALSAIWQQRTDRYSELRRVAGPDPDRVEMSTIGG